MLTGPVLEGILADIVSRPLERTLLRATRLRHAADPLGRNRGLYKPLAAGRFNVEAGSRVLYLADTYETCAQEAQAVAGNLIAIAIIPLHVTLQAVIDLRDPETLDALALTATELKRNFRLRPSPTETQELGETCARSGLIDGILFRSLTPSAGLCLAVIERNLRKDKSHVFCQDPPAELP